ncbi:MAG TPA: hypothetical protein PLJ18_02125 [Niabella sp.]|nr:hypothetical protein [Niabella sp.]
MISLKILNHNKNVSQNTGWKSYSVNLSATECPTDQVANQGETCHTACSTGTTWEEGSLSCKADTTGDFYINNISSSPNYVNTSNTFTWNSDTNDSCASESIS